jgi:RecB family endonuclease NucS
MGTEIKTWQIIGGQLTSIYTALKTEGRTEPYDLEPWLASNPEIIGSDIMIIGRQVRTKSGPIDLLGIDRSGNTVIIEIKREGLPRESLAQAIDYASDVAEWTVERLGEVCVEYVGKTFEEAFYETFSEVDLESVNVNTTQRIVLV